MFLLRSLRVELLLFSTILISSPTIWSVTIENGKARPAVYFTSHTSQITQEEFDNADFLFEQRGLRRCSVVHEGFDALFEAVAEATKEWTTKEVKAKALESLWLHDRELIIEEVMRLRGRVIVDRAGAESSARKEWLENQANRYYDTCYRGDGTDHGYKYVIEHWIALLYKVLLRQVVVVGLPSDVQFCSVQNSKASPIFIGVIPMSSTDRKEANTFVRGYCVLEPIHQYLSDSRFDLLKEDMGNPEKQCREALATLMRHKQGRGGLVDNLTYLTTNQFQKDFFSALENKRLGFDLAMTQGIRESISLIPEQYEQDIDYFKQALKDLSESKTLDDFELKLEQLKQNCLNNGTIRKLEHRIAAVFKTDMICQKHSRTDRSWFESDALDWLRNMNIWLQSQPNIKSKSSGLVKGNADKLILSSNNNIATVHWEHEANCIACTNQKAVATEIASARIEFYELKDLFNQVLRAQSLVRSLEQNYKKQVEDVQKRNLSAEELNEKERAFFEEAEKKKQEESEIERLRVKKEDAKFLRKKNIKAKNALVGNDGSIQEEYEYKKY